MDLGQTGDAITDMGDEARTIAWKLGMDDFEYRLGLYAGDVAEAANEAQSAAFAADLAAITAMIAAVCVNISC
jgi:hypothetical protein